MTEHRQQTILSRISVVAALAQCSIPTIPLFRFIWVRILLRGPIRSRRHRGGILTDIPLETKNNKLFEAEMQDILFNDDDDDYLIDKFYTLKLAA
ncbi:hypothetical protein CMV_015997 [Castanea mollissima]|uniref:Uncharacterized protein n=1 Tax=Castanea mollissima TaxID=60419 RepID=A0A8J4QUP5_9ROSI|nr:hypothetical protein CMV_015997 [Castanea mollissima]